ALRPLELLSQPTATNPGPPTTTSSTDPWTLGRVRERLHVAPGGPGGQLHWLIASRPTTHSARRYPVSEMRLPIAQLWPGRSSQVVCGGVYSGLRWGLHLYQR